MNDPSRLTTGSTERIRAVIDDCVQRRAVGEELPDGAVIAAHPELMPELGDALRGLAIVNAAFAKVEAGLTDSADGSSGVRAETLLSPAVLDAAESTAADRPRPLPHGDSIPGYEILREVHRGGQGVVYQALQKSTKRKVAIKVMKEGPFAGAADKARFEREVQILGQFQHPNIVGVHDSGSVGNNFYFVMDYIPGQPLDVYMAGAAEKEIGTKGSKNQARVGLSIESTLKLFAKICEAVNAAHLRGIIHRDLKPGNIRVDPSGEPHILDFGLAKMSAFDPIGDGSPAMTMTGQFIGSLPWASPEQAEGQPSKIDVRTDVYSLGVILYQMLTGKFPYEVIGNMRDVLDRILRAEPAKPSTVRKQINDEVETIVLKCLSKERERRYQTAGELARDIGHYLAGEPVEAKRDSAMYVLRKQLRRHRLPFAFAVVILLILVGSTVVAWTLYGVGRERLWQSHLSQAHAQRFSGRPGRRIDSLAALTRAAAIRPSLEVRNEAIACLALSDIQVTRLWPESSLDWSSAGLEFNQELSHYVVKNIVTEAIIVRRLEDNQVVLSLPAIARTHGLPAPRLSPNGRFLARPVDDGVEVWDVAEGFLRVHVPANLSRYLQPTEFSPDNRELALGMEDGSVLLYDLMSGQSHTWRVMDAPVHRIRFHPAGLALAGTSAASSDVVICDSTTGAIRRTLHHPNRIWSLAWSTDGTRVVSGCEDWNAYVWDAESGQLQTVLKGHGAPVVSVDFDRTGNLLCSSSWDHLIHFWDPRTGARSLTMTGEQVACASTAAKLAFVRGIERRSYGLADIVSSSAYLTLVGAAQHDISDMTEAVSIRSDGRLAVSSSTSGVRIWDLVGRRGIAFLPIQRTVGAFFEPDGSGLLTAGDRGVMRWPIQTAINRIHLGPPQLVTPNANHEFFNCALSADGGSLIASADKKEAVVVDLSGAAQPRTVGPHANMFGVDLDPFRKWVVTGTRTGRGVKVWDYATGALIRELPIQRSALVGASPDGKWLGTNDGTITIWDASTWEPVLKLDPSALLNPSNFTGPVVFAPDGVLVAATFLTNVIFLANIHTGKIVAQLECPEIINIAQLAFTPDGTRIVFRDDAAHILHVWDLRALRTELATMGLDWDLPRYPPALPQSGDPITVEVDLGDLPAKSSQ